MKKLILLIGLLLPLQVAALEFKNLSLLYIDAPFIPAEAAGISLLTSVNAVEGYPDGTFGPNRTLNRAEFLKIAMASYPKIRVSTSDRDDCFPDVRKDDWFSPYVCLAKRRGMVAGYPDGTFKPERSVNYAEALKILGKLYDYIAYSASDEEWYAGYVRAAEFHKTLLPSSLKYDRALTRGEMARLAAAYRAEYEGQLATYRLSERSFDLVIRQGSSSSASSTSSSTSSSSSSAPMSAISRFLVLGTEELIASGFFRPQAEASTVRNVVAEFRREVKNIKSLYLVDSHGGHIAELKPDTYDQNERTWKNIGPLTTAAVISPQGTMLGLKALIKGPGAGFSEELIQPKSFWVYASALGDETNSYQIIPTNTLYPPHQTAMGRITSVESNLPAVVDFAAGNKMLLAEFLVEAQAAGDAHVAVESLTFTLTTQRGAALSDLRLGSFHTTDTVACAMQGTQYITCPAIPETVGRIDDASIIVQLWGDLQQSESVLNPELQIDLIKPGKISTTINPGELGHLLWTDGTGEFKWLELPEPLAKGSLWK